MTERDDFFDMISGAGIDIAEAQQAAEDIERSHIRREISNEMNKHSIIMAIECTDDEVWTRNFAYLDDLQRMWYLQLSQQAARDKRFRNVSDSELEEAANEKAEADFDKYFGFQSDIAAGIEDTLYAVSHQEVDLESFTEKKNFYLALAMWEHGIETDDQRAKPFIDLYDFMLPGILHGLDSGEFTEYLVRAQILISEKRRADTTD